MNKPRYQLPTVDLTDRPLECDGCGFTTQNLEEYSSDPEYRGSRVRLCELCANTPAGRAIDYPTNAAYKHITEALRNTNYVGNVLLERLSDLESKIADVSAEIERLRESARRDI